MRFIHRVGDWLNEHPFAAMVLVFAVTIAVVVTYQNAQARERRQQICTAVIEDRVLIRDIVGFVGNQGEDTPAPNPNLPPEIQQLIEDSRERSKVFQQLVQRRIELPPDLCKGQHFKIPPQTTTTEAP